jgi:hypothetical protein
MTKNKDKITDIYVQATGEAFSSQKRTSSTSKNEIYELFSMFVFHLCSLGYNTGYVHVF